MENKSEISIRKYVDSYLSNMFNTLFEHRDNKDNPICYYELTNEQLEKFKNSSD